MRGLLLRRLTIFACLFFLIFTTAILADQLVWTPINPSFGGNPFNGDWLIAQAEAQKPEEEEVSEGWQLETDPLEDFSESLNRQILSRLSSRIIETAFGEADLESGHYEIGDFIIDIDATDAGVRVIITDPSTGDDTTIEIPYY